MRPRLHLAAIAALPLLFAGASGRHAVRSPAPRPVSASAAATIHPRRTAASKPPMVEARALWVPRDDYSAVDTTTIVQVMEFAARVHFNVVFFQVRGPSDAIYRSGLDPCSVRLCGGRLGGVAPLDPLEVAVRQAHRRGLQIHAWLNALSGWESTSKSICDELVPSAPGQPNHELIDHPEWAIHLRSGNPHRCPNEEEYVFLSPAVAGVRTHLARVAADVVRRYDVDGIHLDRIRYPGPDFGWDPAALAAFGRSPSADPAGWARFRTEMVDSLVREVHDSIDAVRPVPLSAAVWPIYDRRHLGWTQPPLRSSSGIEEYFQDSWGWARDGYLDAAVPMTYARITDPECEYIPAQGGRDSNPDWRCMVRDHVAGMRPTGRLLLAGIDASVGADEMVREIELGRQLGVNGFSLLKYSNVAEHGRWRALLDGPFRDAAAVPPMPWLH
jgi:uncharacterized lipoprotein YddW (UPF0748 family)